MTASKCSFSACSNQTKDPSGRCHHHRSGSGAQTVTATSISVIPLSAIGGSEEVDDTPVSFTRDSSYESYTELTEWRRPDGNRHRDDGPAVVRRDMRTGRITDEIYYREGEVFRVDGPAAIAYHPNGKVRSEHYRIGASHSRLDGPAAIYYDEDGAVEQETWEVGGRDLEANEETYASALATFTPEQQARLVEGSTYAVFIDEGYTVEQITAAVFRGVTTFEGMREVLEGAPVEWVVAYESARS